mmetsp:Transcript_42133/g.96754  ORF Transcript_42133/g.96754 Transcript_42133/m.96754 type:complete len:781 (-) Transcript_42133:56-2398(-)
MGVWETGAPDHRKELVVALTHRFNDVNRRADDEEYIVGWESDGETLQEVLRVETSCPNVELTVPPNGPYVFESRVDLSGSSVHPECSCVPSSGHVCPRGAQVQPGPGTAYILESPSISHFVSAQNEWAEMISDPVTLDQVYRLVDLPVRLVTASLPNVSDGARQAPSQACPGTYDELLGTEGVTRAALQEAGIRLPDGHVDGGWCLVWRGGCADTAKVKVCEESGADGTIIIDHGNFDDDGDQHVVIQYSRSAQEFGVKPVMFISRSEGEKLLAQMDAGHVNVSIGPSVAGHAPLGYSAGSGIIVHAIGSQASPGLKRKHWPDVFGTAGWIEVSDLRSLLFVCVSSDAEVRLFNTSDPMQSLPLVGKINVPCSKYGYHDYHVVDYYGHDGRFMTMLVDPNDRGNQLMFYDTHDPSNPVYVDTFRVTWESANDGLGQVRAIPPAFRFHAVTWHCSHLYCGENHGKKLHIMDAHDTTKAPVEIPLPMLSTGGFARDIQCTSEGLCLASLTWDGVVALDGGMQNTVNEFKIIAQHIGDSSTFSGSAIPATMAHYRFFSGAQKIYPSKRFARRFYIEHGDLSLRPLRQGDYISALLLNQVYIASIESYTPSEYAVDLSNPDGTIPTPHPTTSPDVVLDKEDEERHGRHKSLFIAAVVMLTASLAVTIATSIFCFIAWRANNRKLTQIQRLTGMQDNEPRVVVGRPVGDPEGQIASATGIPLGQPSVVSVPTKKKAQPPQGSPPPLPGGGFDELAAQNRSAEEASNVARGSSATASRGILQLDFT